MYTALVIEDESLLASSIEHKLSKKGWHALMAPTIQEGLVLLSEHREAIDFIWLDYYLPRENALDFIRQMKDQDDWGAPIFAITNTAGPEVLSQLMAAGVVQTFVKGNHQLGSIIAYIEAYLTENPRT